VGKLYSYIQGKTDEMNIKAVINLTMPCLHEMRITIDANR